MSFDDVTQDAFLGGRLHLWQPRKGYRAGVDPVLLAASVPAIGGQSVLDLGCGAGAAALCLATRVSRLSLVGLEMQAGFVDLARRNAEGAGQDMRVYQGNVRLPPETLRPMSFDHVLANPPFYDRTRGSMAPDAAREAAMGEDATLSDWVRCGAKRLKPKGYFHMILKADRLADALTALSERLGSLEILPLAPRMGRDAELVILRARKEGRAALKLHAPVVLHEGESHPGDTDHDSTRVSDVLRRGVALEF